MSYFGVVSNYINLKFLTNRVKLKVYPYIQASGTFSAEKKEFLSVFLVYGLFGFRGMDVVVVVGVYGKNYALEILRCDQLETERSLLKKRFVSLLLLNQKFEERLELYTPTNIPLHYTHTCKYS